MAEAVRFCVERGQAYTARGAGTNLSGGAVALSGGAIISLARMNRVLAVDTAAREAVVESGTVNAVLQRELERENYFYAPDPASWKVSTLGGNIAENAGGPRCLKYGVTTNHVLGVEAVMPDGSAAAFSSDDPGPDLMSLLVGSEGTLGLVTKARLKIAPAPPAVATFLAGFPSVESAMDCVSAVIAAGVIPRAMEAMDDVLLRLIEARSPCGYPKTPAVLLIELDGQAAQVAEESAKVEALCRAQGAVDLRSARDARERDRLWEGRRGAYASMARLAPNVLVEDGAVPRPKLSEVVRRIRQVAARRGLSTPLLFHAGDG
ncbi:MAG: FAD-binding protein, partial [Elusimicrobia bacterium]|nr:FAD-binding protein [Elusimicrobiota bacterium]